MIINQFRKFTPINIFYLLIIGFVLCLGFLINLPESLPEIKLEPIINQLAPFNIRGLMTLSGNVVLTAILTFLQALIFNRIILNYSLLGKVNYLTALIFITLASSIPVFLFLSPALICNFITIWMLNKLFSISKLPDAKSLMFDLGLIIALGSLIYFPFVMMLPLLWISLLIFRTFYWREWIAPLLGYVVIYFLIGNLYFWMDRLPEFLQFMIPFKKNIIYDFHFQLEDYFVLFPIGLSLILFLVVLKNHFFKSVVQLRKSFQLVFYMLLLIICSFFLFENTQIDHFLLCVPGLSIYLAYYYSHAKNKWIYEGLYIASFISILYLQYT